MADKGGAAYLKGAARGEQISERRVQQKSKDTPLLSSTKSWTPSSALRHTVGAVK
ncbi:hypothetical protein OAF27_02430 [Verrucomicrobiales bacterium]|nr:hypothetical protein [Verrucomicrobiales bacterium]